MRGQAQRQGLTHGHTGTKPPSSVPEMRPRHIARHILYIHICIYMYLCVCIFIYMYMSICLYVCVHVQYLS